MSKPVTSTEEGKYLSNAKFDFCGYSGVHSSVENAQSEDENHVSRTSSSLFKTPV